eukprot:CAMPEP_0197646632 /NCGR_PEP_ID=MMETSP1338-20131121/23758_1 /TAXON_ID=43686 ORGANISM="Pelagodinium beii, Strain RCC1491" /NCGR_SAMPLE_ID=MMETSP1338 /ASSEMBLY_ACC=CAM_ASM_000754 /LENGTH=446 /DNA_ID=CAMNT_0043220287 /DNA_START=126 /DNA_END=1466 /DNA_ORIENTATION=+
MTATSFIPATTPQFFNEQTQQVVPQQPIMVMLVPAEQFQQGCFPGAPQFQQFQMPMEAKADMMPFQPQMMQQHGQVQQTVLYEMPQTHLQVPYDTWKTPGTAYDDWKTPSTDLSEAGDDHSEQRGRLTVSAARRLRRRRAAERASYELARGAPVAAGEVIGQGFTQRSLETLQQKLSEGPDGVEEVSKVITGHVWSLSKDSTGCRLVQTVLERAGQRDAAALAQELRGHVREAATSPHANYVLQKVISQLTFSATSFVAEELLGNCSKMAKHRFGCRILCRFMEFYSSRDSTMQMVDELLHDVGDLCCQNFGHHVIQSVLEHGDERHRKLVAEELCSDPARYAKHRNASYLIEKALCYCCSEDQQTIVRQLAHPEIIADLARTQYGSFVARALLQHEKMDPVKADMTFGVLAQSREELLETRHGQRLLIDLGLASSAEVSEDGGKS